MAAAVLELSDPGVLPVLRQHPVGPLLELFNVTPDWRPWPVERVRAAGIAEPWDALTGRPVSAGDDGALWLSPYAALWLVERPS